MDVTVKDINELGQQLRKVRKAANIDARTLSLMSGCGENKVSEIERGVSTKQLDAVFTIFENLGIEIKLALPDA